MGCCQKVKVFDSAGNFIAFLHYCPCYPYVLSHMVHGKTGAQVTAILSDIIVKMGDVQSGDADIHELSYIEEGADMNVAYSRHLSAFKTILMKWFAVAAEHQTSIWASDYVQIEF